MLEKPQRLVQGRGDALQPELAGRVLVGVLDQPYFSPSDSNGEGTGSEDLEILVRLMRGWLGRTLTDSFRVNAPPLIRPRRTINEASPQTVPTRLVPPVGPVRVASAREVCTYSS